MFNSPYAPSFNPINAGQRAELIALIQKHGLGELQDYIVEMARTGIVLETAVEGVFTTGCSRLGGLPDVPSGWVWPEKLVFLGQLNLEEMAPHDFNHLLPERGLLSFFHFPDFRDSASFPHRIYFFEDLNNLKQASAPSGYLPVEHTNEYCVYNALRVEPRTVISLPPFYSRGWSELSEIAEEGELALFENNYPRILGELHPYSGRHKLLGYHSFMDGDADEDAWQASLKISTNYASVSSIGKRITPEQRESTLRYLENTILQYRDSGDERMALYHEQQHEAYTAYVDNKAAIDASLQDWVLLFQMSSDSAVGANFWRFGFACFMIRRQDLAAKRFDQTYAG